MKNYTIINICSGGHVLMNSKRGAEVNMIKLTV